MDKNGKPLIGVLLNQINGRYQSQLRYGLNDFAKTNDVSFLYLVGKSIESPYKGENDFNSIYSLAFLENIDGLIIFTGSVGAFVTQEKLEDFVKSFSHLPIVTIGIPVASYPFVNANTNECIKELILHLVCDHEYKHIAFLAGPENNADAESRKISFLDAMKDANCKVNPDLIFQGDFSYSSGERVARLLGKNKILPFEAIVSANDDMAMGFINALKEFNFFAPKDYAITGIDDIKEAQFFHPSLTTINQMIYNQGYTAAFLMFSKLSESEKVIDKSLENKKNVFFNPTILSKLYIRESCGCANAQKLKHKRIPFASSKSDEAKALSIEEIISFVTIDVFPFPYLETIKTAVNVLLDQLILDIRTFRSDSLFLQTLTGWLEVTSDVWHNFSDIWEKILSSMQNKIVVQLEDVRTFAYVENLFMHAMNSLTYKLNKMYSEAVCVSENTITNSFNSTMRFSKITSFEELYTAIQELLISYNFDFLYFAFQKSSLPCVYENVRYTKITQSEINPNAENFLQNAFEKNKSVVVLPLVNSGISYGYFALSDSAKEPMLYDFFRELITQGILSIEMSLPKSFRENYLDSIPLVVLETDFALNVTKLNKNASVLFQSGKTNYQQNLNLRKYLVAEENVINVILKEVQENFVDLPNVYLKNVDKKTVLPLLRLQRTRENTICWSFFEILNLASVMILPNDSFFQSHNITFREKEIILYMLQGLRIKDISEKLFIAESTVKGHLSQIYTKFDVIGRHELLNLIKENVTGANGKNVQIFSLLANLLECSD